MGFLLLLLIGVQAICAENMSRDDLYRLLFKAEPPPRQLNFMANFYVDNRKYADVEIFYDSAFTVFEFSSKRFSNYLDTLLNEESLAALSRKDGHFNSRNLDSLDFIVNLNESMYELRINVPSERKVLQRTSMRSSSLNRGTLLEPAFFSFYLNMRVSDFFNCQDDCKRLPADLVLDGATAMFGFVLEGSGNVKEPRAGEEFGASHIKRNDFRLIRDLYSINSRISFGDVGVNTGGLMLYETMGGARYEYNKRFFDANRNNIFDDLYKIHFFLPKASQVEIQINNRTARRLNLPAGQHEISGFGGREGENIVQILITREDGSIENIPYEFQLGNSRNLFKSELRFSTAAGLRRSNTATGYDYEMKEPGFNADLLYGLFPALSLGLSAQASEYNLMVGSQFLWSLNSSNWLELRGLLNYEADIGMRSELRYTHNAKLVSLSITGYCQNLEYNPSLFNTLTKTGTSYGGLSNSISTVFLRGSLSANAGIVFNRETESVPPVSKRYGAGISQNFFGFFLNANASADLNKDVWLPYASIGVIYSFGLDRHNFNLTNNTNIRSWHVPERHVIFVAEDEKEVIPDDTEYEWMNRSALNWSWSSGGSGVGAHSYFSALSMQNNFENIGFRFGTRHSHNRAVISAGYNLYNHNQLAHSMRADIGTSFMFADGVWAFGRPVNRGFILAGTGKRLSGSTVHINYSDYYNSSFSKNGWLGAAYYNQISNYRANEIRISLTDAPIGIWLEQNRYYSMGAYKQGYAVRLGNDASSLLHVDLLREDGPLVYTYVSVDLLDKDGNIVRSRATFTSREGTLLIGNIKPGNKYRLNFGSNSPLKGIDLDIPENAGNFIELPDIKAEYK